MNHVVLNNGISMPQIGLGVFRITDEAEAVETVASAIRVGYRHIDTATIYKNEAAIGRGIQKGGITRNDIFVTTKVWNDAQRENRVAEAFEDSLRALRFEYVDLYLTHWPVPVHFRNTWKSLEVIYRHKKARAIGVSNHRIEDLEAIASISDIVPAVNQVEMHPYLQQEELVQYCNEKGIRVEAWGPFTAGQTDVLSDPVLTEIAQAHEKSTAQVILRWLVQRGVTPLSKSSNSQRQRQNLDIFNFALSSGEMDAIAKLDRAQRLGRDPKDSDF